MQLLHLANYHSTNIGNGALIYGTERVLRDDIDVNLQFTPEAWDEYVIENDFGPRSFDASFVEKVNAHDGLLVGGAVTFNGRAHLTNAGMRFNLPLELWSEIKKPIIFYGNSYRFWPGSTYHNSDALRSIIEYIEAADHVFFGVRNDGTKQFLESVTGVSSEKVIPIPDPGMYVPQAKNEYPEIVDGNKNILISLNNEDEEGRFPDPSKKQHFVESFARFMTRLADDFDVNYVLCPHYFDDYKIMSELVDLLPGKIVHQRTISTGLLSVPQTEYFYGRYRQADLALSMRIHSLSPSIGMHTPVIPMSSQHRVSDFLEDIGIGDIAVDVFDPNIEETLLTKTALALSDPETLQSKVTNAANAARERTRAHNQTIKAMLER